MEVEAKEAWPLADVVGDQLHGEGPVAAAMTPSVVGDDIVSLRPANASLRARRLLVVGKAGVGKSTVTDQLVRAGAGLGLVDCTRATVARREATIANKRHRLVPGNSQAWIMVECRSAESIRRVLRVGRGGGTVLWIVDPTRPLPVQGNWIRTALAALSIRNVVLCVNRMDEIAFDQKQFADVVAHYRGVALPSSALHVASVPVAATHGCNIVSACEDMPWYGGLPLAKLLSLTPSTAPTYG